MSALSVTLSCMAHDIGMAIYTAPIKAHIDMEVAKYNHKKNKEAKEAAKKEAEEQSKVEETTAQQSKIEEKKAEKPVRKTSKEVKKSKEEVFKEALKAASSDSDVDTRVMSYIQNTQQYNPVQKIELVKRAKKTQKLLNYILYYITSTEACKITDLTKAEKEFCNAIADRFYTAGIIYEEVGNASLDLYDVENVNITTMPKFLFAASAVRATNTMDVRAKINKVIADLHPTEDEPVKEEVKEPAPDSIVVNPFKRLIVESEDQKNDLSFDLNGDVVMNPVDDVDPQLEAKIEQLVVPKLPEGFKHRYTMDPSGSGLVVLYVKRPGIGEIAYLVDPGLIYGKDIFSLGCNIPTNDFQGTFIDFIPFDIEEPIRKTIEGIYILNDSEIEESYKYHQFDNRALYRYIDMSDVAVRDIPDDKMFILTNKLSDIINVLLNNNGNNYAALPRMRFTKFDNPDSFVLVSDRYVKNPIINVANNMVPIIEGLVVNVDGNDMMITMPDKTEIKWNYIEMDHLNQNQNLQETEQTNTEEDHAGEYMGQSYVNPTVQMFNNLQAGQVFQQPDPQVIPMPNPAFQRGMVVNNTDIIR